MRTVRNLRSPPCPRLHRSAASHTFIDSIRQICQGRHPRFRHPAIGGSREVGASRAEAYLETAYSVRHFPRSRTDILGRIPHWRPALLGAIDRQGWNQDTTIWPLAGPRFHRMLSLGIEVRIPNVYGRGEKPFLFVII